MKFKKVKVKDEASILTKRTKGEKILYGIVLGVFTIYCIILLYPLLLDTFSNVRIVDCHNSHPCF